MRQWRRIGIAIALSATSIAVIGLWTVFLFRDVPDVVRVAYPFLALAGVRYGVRSLALRVLEAPHPSTVARIVRASSAALASWWVWCLLSGLWLVINAPLGGLVGAPSRGSPRAVTMWARMAQAQ
jgi:hypothetical protein